MAIKARNQQVVRQWRLVQLLASGRRTRRELARELQVGKRTIARDIAALEEAYLPIVEGEGFLYILTGRPFGLQVSDMAGAR